MEDITAAVRERYAKAARLVAGEAAAACGCGTKSSTGCDPITSNLYGDSGAGDLPESALRASLGCGNPTALAELKPGESVLDLGSGGGFDVLLSARRVGPTGTVYGLDMTDEMLSLAEQHRRAAGATNVRFLKGYIEAVPLPANAVDVVISNCVINLSADKDRVLSEAFRVLRPGGRLAVSDVVIRGDMPADIRRSMELWVGCIAGALTESQYRDALQKAGFVDIAIETTRAYTADDARGFLEASGLDTEPIARLVDGKVTSAIVRARKPETRGCCGPTCCA